MIKQALKKLFLAIFGWGLGSWLKRVAAVTVVGAIVAFFGAVSPETGAEAKAAADEAKAQVENVQP